MRFYQDQRGQSVVVGTVILFGFLIIALSLYQAQIVPSANSAVEFEHTQQVQEDFLDLRNTIVNVATTGNAQSTAITLGTRYPQRTFFLNPPPATGAVDTTSLASIEINGTIATTAHPNVQSFWTDGNPVFETRAIQYTPRYNELRSAGQLTYEQSLVTTSVGEGVVLRSEQRVVRDGSISLTTVRGNLSETGITAEAIDVSSVSSQAQTVPITGDGSDIELRVPARVGNVSALVDRLSIPGAESVSADGDTIVITLNGTATYRLGLSAVAVDTSGQPAPAYIVPVDGETATVGQRIGVEVRDKYNNPVPDTTVDIGGETVTTDDTGRAFTTPTTNGELVAQLATNPEPYEEVTFTIQSAGTETGGAVAGPNVTVDSADQSVTVTAGDTIELGDRGGGGDVTLAGSITSVGSLDQLRSGTPIQAIQYDVVGPDGAVFINDAQYAQLDTDISERTFAFSDTTGVTTETLIDTSSWPTGENTLQLSAQDASGRISPDVDRGIVNVTVQDGGATTPQYPTSTSVNNNDGTLNNPDNLRADDGNVAEFRGEGGGGSAFDIDVVTEQVPAGDYTLETEVTGGSFQGGGVDVTVTDANGVVIGTGQISSTGLFTLDLDPSVEGDITVRYQARNQNSNLDVDFQRLT